MIGRIVTWLVVIVIGLFIYAWLASGGWALLSGAASHYGNPISWFFIQQQGKVVKISGGPQTVALPAIQPQLTALNSTVTSEQLEYAKDFGNPSPDRGKVTMSQSTLYGPANLGGTGEYITLIASAQNTKPISLSGWSVMSAASGIRIPIPLATTLYRLGTAPMLAPISLSPGDSALLNSGTSPVGVSFRTNICTGYLGQFQNFSPELSNNCPSPRSEMPNTLDNQIAYGASCIDFVATIPSCTYYLGTFPSDINDACRSFVQNALSYNSCVNRYEWDSNFAGNTWRVYLGAGDNIWNDRHDVIRLLDAQGRTVDVWSY